MTIDIKLLSQDLTSQIELVRLGEVSADEINQQQQALVEKLNPSLNCFISHKSVPPVTALQNSRILQGLTIAVKDNIDINGFNTTAGLDHRRDHLAANDAFVITQLRNAGASFSGKLNMHEAALGATNHNPHFGDCYNPHKLGYTPGGSSGGSGAAVAACLAPATLGSDTMGSVRIPAAYNGVFGFKASQGAVSNSGSVVCSRIMDHIGPLARSADDIRLLMNIIEKFDPACANSRQYKYFDLKAQYTFLVPEDLSELGVEADVLASFNINIQVFKDLGHNIEYFQLSPTYDPYDFSACRRAGLIICEADILIENKDAWKNKREQFSPYLASMMEFIETRSATDIIKAERVLDNAKIKAREILSHGDFILMPTAPQRAFSMDAAVPANQADLTSFANQAGLAAISIPMIDDNPLPAGMQIVGHAGCDDQIIDLAQKWQTASGYKFKVPQPILNLL